MGNISDEMKEKVKSMDKRQDLLEKVVNPKAKKAMVSKDTAMELDNEKCDRRVALVNDLGAWALDWTLIQDIT